MAFTFSNLAFYVSSFLLKKMISESHEKMNENFDTIHDDSHLSTSVIVEETEIQPLNNELQTLLLENQTLKNQLDRALQFTNEIENIRSKNSELQSKLHQSQLPGESEAGNDRPPVRVQQLLSGENLYPRSGRNLQFLPGPHTDPALKRAASGPVAEGL